MQHLTRQSDLIPQAVLKTPITVIGAGAIGSFTVLSLCKMGFTDITVYDFDVVSVENMSCQWYRFEDIGRPKVEALAEIIFMFTQVRIRALNEKFLEQRIGSGIVISAVDSMAVRKTIWESIKGKPFIKWLIDPRMAAEYALSYVMAPNDDKDQIAYEKTLYSDANSVQEPCTAKATMYTAAMIAGHVAKQVKDLVTEKPYARVTDWNIGINKQTTWGKPDENPDRRPEVRT